MNPKDTAGQAKPQMHLIPVGALGPLARVMELGAKKYGPYNWRETPVNYTTYLSAVGRHCAAFLDGQDQDPESGQSHLAHIAAGMMILLDAIVTGNAKDDRPPKNPAYAEPAPHRPVLDPAQLAALPENPDGSRTLGTVKAGGTFPQDIEWAPGVSCGCETCTTLRALKANQPTKNDAHRGTGASQPATP